MRTNPFKDEQLAEGGEAEVSRCTCDGDMDQNHIMRIADVRELNDQM